MVLKESFVGAARRRTFICCRNVQISASSIDRDRSRSTTNQPISLQRSLIPHEDCLILDQLPAGWVCDRDSPLVGGALGDVMALESRYIETDCEALAKLVNLV